MPAAQAVHVVVVSVNEPAAHTVGGGTVGGTAGVVVVGGTVVGGTVGAISLMQ